MSSNLDDRVHQVLKKHVHSGGSRLLQLSDNKMQYEHYIMGKWRMLWLLMLMLLLSLMLSFLLPFLLFISCYGYWWFCSVYFSSTSQSVVPITSYHHLQLWVITLTTECIEFLRSMCTLAAQGYYNWVIIECNEQYSFGRRHMLLLFLLLLLL